MLLMRVLFVIAVCLAASVPARAAEPAGPGPAASSQPQFPSPQPGAKRSPLAEPERKQPGPALAVTVTDDADSTRQPAFATPSTPMPKKLYRVGVEWSF
jgi:hypothetical protein